MHSWKKNQAPILSKPGVILHIHHLPVVEACCFSPGAVSDQVKGRIQAETSWKMNFPSSTRGPSSELAGALRVQCAPLALHVRSEGGYETPKNELESSSCVHGFCCLPGSPLVSPAQALGRKPGDLVRTGPGAVLAPADGASTRGEQAGGSAASVFCCDFGQQHPPRAALSGVSSARSALSVCNTLGNPWLTAATAKPCQSLTAGEEQEEDYPARQPAASLCSLLWRT